MIIIHPQSKIPCKPEYKARYLTEIAAHNISRRLKCESLWRFAVARQGPVIPHLIATNKTCDSTVLPHLDDSGVEDGNLKIQLTILNIDVTS
jgi:hypothetical protein